MSTSPFRSTKLNSGLTVMSSLTLSVSILVTGYVKSPKNSHETCDATGLWASALADLLQFSQKYLPRESVVSRIGSPEATSALPFDRVRCVDRQPLDLLRDAVRDLGIAPCRMWMCCLYSGAPGMDRLHSRADRETRFTHPTRRSALADRFLQAPTASQLRCRGVQSSSGVLPMPPSLGHQWTFSYWAVKCGRSADLAACWCRRS